MVDQHHSRWAAIYVAWGSLSIKEAINSVQLVQEQGLDAFLFTDEESLAFVESPDLFEKIIVYRFEMIGNRRKTEIFDILPDGYDVFVYLDTDVHILADISLGFEKAARHGMAAAMAPHYSLEHYWGFETVMDKYKADKKSIMQYNAGVLFFSLATDVMAVLKRWHALCREEAETKSWGEGYNQPFLTLAMEQLHFNPYTLSPSYNYRNFGEAASGLIRIWHSHLPPPPDVNLFEEPWPPRSFCDSRRGGPNFPKR
jgi:hypothetical protein